MRYRKMQKPGQERKSSHPPPAEGKIRLPKPVLDSIRKHTLSGSPAKIIETECPTWLQARLLLLATKNMPALATMVEKSNMGRVLHLSPQKLRTLNLGTLSTFVGTSLSLKSLRSIRRFCDAVTDIIALQQIVPIRPSLVKELVIPEEMDEQFFKNLENSGAGEKFEALFREYGVDDQVNSGRFVFLAAQLTRIIQQ